MDVLSREAQEHGEIFESIAFFKQSLSAMSAGDYGLVEKIQRFLRDSIVEHFKYEEKNVFEPILSQGTLKEKMFIRDLQSEHLDILREIDVFENIAARCKVGGAVKVPAIRAAARTVIGLMHKHARREDLRLFSIAEKYQ
jgi:hemerythrin-like domain-containing protein